MERYGNLSISTSAGRIVAAIVAMAEGIETEAQYRFLSETLGQGFGYARPQPAVDFLRQDVRVTAHASTLAPSAGE